MFHVKPMFSGFAVDGPVVGRFMQRVAPRAVIPVLWTESGFGFVVYAWEGGSWRSGGRYHGAVEASGGAPHEQK